MDKYFFTSQQLSDLLGSTIDMYDEYQFSHGHKPQSAREAAIAEIFDGLEADKELVEMGENNKLMLQLPINKEIADEA